MKKLGIGIAIAIAGVIGIIMKARSSSVSVIGGADGPTAIFIAGKYDSTLPVIVLIAVIVLLIIGLFLCIRKRK